MIFVGTPAQREMSQILLHIERYEKTGLLTVVRGLQIVRLYFRQGQLMSIEPRQDYDPLERRLLRAGIISQLDLQYVEFVMSTTVYGNPDRAYHNEIQMALALTESELVSHEQLYTWMRQEITEILRELLTWPAVEVSFVEEVLPPVDRLSLALSITSLLPLSSDPISFSSISTSNPRSVREELSLSLTPRFISSTPQPVLKLKHPTFGTRFKKQFTVHASKKRYKVFTGVLFLLLFFMQGAMAWAPMEKISSAPSLNELNASIANAEQYITQLYKPINSSIATIAEYYGVPLRVYLTRYHSWILLGENSSTSAIINVENRQTSESFVIKFQAPQSSHSFWIGVDINWNYDSEHYQMRFTNKQFDDLGTTALVYLYDLYIDTFSTTNISRSTSLTFAKTDITHLHSFRYTIRHGNQLAQNYYWYKRDGDKYERLARFIAQQGYQLDYDIYAPIWGYGTAYPDDLPFHISNGDGYEAYHDCHASSWNDALNYLYQSKVCKVGVAIYIEVSQNDLLTVSIQSIHILNKYNDPEHSYSNGGNQQTTPLHAAVALEQKFDQTLIGIPMCSPIGCNYGLASGVRTFSFGALETMLGYRYGRQKSQEYADSVARLALQVQVGDNDKLLMADGSTFYRPAQKGAFYLSWNGSMRFAQNTPFGYQYINNFLNMPSEYRGVLVSDMETTFNAYAFLVLYRCEKYKIGCATAVPKPSITG